MLVSSTRISLQDRYIPRARGVILINVIFGDMLQEAGDQKIEILVFQSNGLL